MAAVMKDENMIKVLSGAASASPWIDCGPGIQIKVLAVDMKHHAVQYLARTGPGHNPGIHRHNADGLVSEGHDPVDPGLPIRAKNLVLRQGNPRIAIYFVGILRLPRVLSVLEGVHHQV